MPTVPAKMALICCTIRLMATKENRTCSRIISINILMNGLDMLHNQVDGN